LAAKLGAQQGNGLWLNNLDHLDPGSAEALSKQQGDLLMDSLTNLSDEVASALAKHQGCLSLRGLIILGDTAARALAQHKNLSLNEDLKDMLATTQAGLSNDQ
jgi:hypothetical protein